MFPAHIHDLAREVINACTGRKLRVATAESCTGGLVAAALTQIPESSAVFERGFVTYSNAAKTELLDVAADVIEKCGAVSAEVAEAMAEGALTHSPADVALSVTGIAGPGGATLTKPIGLVYFGLATREGSLFHYSCHFKGDRDDVRMGAVGEALNLLISFAAGE